MSQYLFQNGIQDYVDNVPDSKRLCASMEQALMDHLRLYHHPVGLTYLFSNDEVENFKKLNNYVIPAKPMTFCQWEIAARMQGKTVLGTSDKLICTGALSSFGWKALDNRDLQSSLKYCIDEQQTKRFIQDKPHFEFGVLKAIGIQPLSSCANIPHVVHMLCDSLQGYHLAIDFMAVTNIHPLTTQILMSSSSCGGGVYCYQSSLYNYTTPCSGSYNSGKMERSESNVFIPGIHILAVVSRMIQRIRQTGGSSITRLGDYFPGADICKNCPIIHFA